MENQGMALPESAQSIMRMFKMHTMHAVGYHSGNRWIVCGFGATVEEARKNLENRITEKALEYVMLANEESKRNCLNPINLCGELLRRCMEAHIYEIKNNYHYLEQCHKEA